MDTYLGLWSCMKLSRWWCWEHRFCPQLPSALQALGPRTLPSVAFLQQRWCDWLHSINALFSYAPLCVCVCVCPRVHTHHPALLRQVLPDEGPVDPGQGEARSESASCSDERRKLQLRCWNTHNRAVILAERGGLWCGRAWKNSHPADVGATDRYFCQLWPVATMSWLVR